MSQRQERSTGSVILASLGWPVIFGLSATVFFYVLLHRGPLNTPLMHRYFAGHPVCYAETAMFFVGAVALLIKLFNVAGQFRTLGGIGLDTAPDQGLAVSDVGRLLDGLERLSARARFSYFGTRLRDALGIIERKGSAAGLGEELKYLADLDVAKQQDSYSLVRIVTWATPMLGFLGTVMGITQALGDLNPQELATNIEHAMEGLLAGLYVAFDTTALALTLSIVLMFVQFAIDRFEGQLLTLVDSRTNDELIGRFQEIGPDSDPLLVVDQLVRRQTELWRGTIDAAQQQWASLADSAGNALHEALAGALDVSLQRHAAALVDYERTAAERTAEWWHQWQQNLAGQAHMLQTQQSELAKQTELLGQLAHATGDVVKLETALNRNLESLAGVKQFEEAVMTLTAAVHLLNARWGQEERKVTLTPNRTQGRAA